MSALFLALDSKMGRETDRRAGGDGFATLLPFMFIAVLADSEEVQEEKLMRRRKANDVTQEANDLIRSIKDPYDLVAKCVAELRRTTDNLGASMDKVKSGSQKLAALLLSPSSKTDLAEALQDWATAIADTAAAKASIRMEISALMTATKALPGVKAKDEASDDRTN